MKSQVGFIDSENMGNAIINGVITKQLLNPEQIAVFDILKDKLADRITVNSIPFKLKRYFALTPFH